MKKLNNNMGILDKNMDIVIVQKSNCHPYAIEISLKVLKLEIIKQLMKEEDKPSLYIAEDLIKGYTIFKEISLY